MSAPKLYTVADLGAFDTIIDARSPAEFADDHIPGAINLPVLDDEQRRIVGTMYVQQGAFEARRVGGAMVAAQLARHLQEALADKPARWRPLVYCWRGGMRSGSMVQWLRLVGWDAQPLASGYKTWRRHVMTLIDARAPRLDLRVVCGATGSAKTRVLHALAGQGAQVLDLEGLAVHKGSVLGGIPGRPQPSQKLFETALATALEALDLSRPVYIEAESRKIGSVALPNALVERMRAAPCIEIDAPPAARLAFLLGDYAYLGDDPARLSGLIGQLHGLQANETLKRWQQWAADRALAPLFEELMTLHYDPMYARSQHGNYLRLAAASRVGADALDAPGIVDVARRILALEGAPAGR